jgi:hypothetical protein
MGMRIRLGPASVSSRGRVGLRAGPVSVYGGGRRRRSRGAGPLVVVAVLILTCVGALIGSGGSSTTVTTRTVKVTPVRLTCDDGTTPTMDGYGDLNCDDFSTPTCPDGSWVRQDQASEPGETLYWCGSRLVAQGP